MWGGEAKRITYLPNGMEKGQGCAVIVQPEAPGPIIGAAMIRPSTS